MKHIVFLLSTLLIGGSVAFADDMRASMAIEKTTKMSMSADATYKDIKATLGIVPSMFKAIPQSYIASAWSEFKALQLSPDTALSGLEKELIGLGVAAQIPCKYCVAFHQDAARFNGASDEQIKETIALAATQRHWSTFLSGAQEDLNEFKKFTDNFLSKIQNQSDSQTTISMTEPTTTAEQAYSEMEKVFGEVPAFIKRFPKAALPGAWSYFKQLSLNDKTTLTPKQKNLISLAASAQSPCPHCVYFDTKSAQANGATEQEINEAIGMASIVRHWSTVLNGSQQPEVEFKKEMASVWKFLKSKKNTAS